LLGFFLDKAGAVCFKLVLNVVEILGYGLVVVFQILPVFFCGGWALLLDIGVLVSVVCVVWAVGVLVGSVLLANDDVGVAVRWDFLVVLSAEGLIVAPCF